MTLRIHLDDAETAEELAERIDALGHEVAVVTERFAGEDDDEALEYVVCTSANRGQLVDLIDDETFVTED